MLEGGDDIIVVCHRRGQSSGHRGAPPSFSRVRVTVTVRSSHYSTSLKTQKSRAFGTVSIVYLFTYLLTYKVTRRNLMQYFCELNVKYCAPYERHMCRSQNKNAFQMDKHLYIVFTHA